MSEQKWYVVWVGKKPGVYSTWEECRAQIHGVKGAQYKSYKGITRRDAEHLLNVQSVDNPVYNRSQIDPDAIAVDAACSGNPGKMEYRGVVVETGDEVFHSRVYPLGTNNIGEFLAIVHALAGMVKVGFLKPVYSDSSTAINWVRAGKCKSKLERNSQTELLWQHVQRAEAWLARQDLSRFRIHKWDTRALGEIPADFGRK